MPLKSTRTVIIWSASALVASALVVAAVILLTRTPKDAPRGPASAHTPPTARVLVRTRVSPGTEARVVAAPDGPSVTLPPGVIAAPVDVTIAAVDEPAPHATPLPHAFLGAWDITVGDQRFFSENIIVALPYDPARLPPGIAPEFALTASYWDESLEAWLEMPSVVDETTRTQLVPTRHLTTIRQDAVLAEGHAYNDHFSIKYDPGERDAMKRRHANFADVFDRQPAQVLEALE
jgi:hypothetical protein